jgi:DNA-binding transcriptional LysR family regulator
MYDCFMIDLVALRSLKAIDVHGSVVGAAEALGYSPSAISQQIKRLDKHFGLPSLEKLGRGIMLTEHGRRLAEQGASLLAQVERLESGVQAEGGKPIGAVRVSAHSTACRGLLAPMLAELEATDSAVTVTFVENDPWVSIDLVATGQVDLAVVHNWNTQPLRIPAHIETLDLSLDVADVLVHHTHRLASRSKVTPGDLVDERWVSTMAGSICHEWLVRMFADIGADPHIPFYDSEFATHIALVEQGVAVGLLPRLGRPLLPETVVAVRVVDPVPTRNIQLIWRRTMSQSPAIRHLAAILQTIANPRLRRTSSESRPVAERGPSRRDGEAATL